MNRIQKKMRYLLATILIGWLTINSAVVQGPIRQSGHPQITRLAPECGRV